MVFYQFQQAGKEEYQSLKKWNSAVGIVAAGSQWNSSRKMGNSEFRYGIAKISQGLRKFRNHSKNFAILAKFRYGHIFAMIAKIRCHSESYCA